jgi:NAD(P)-dependent dehydrogenase (short-subunit alcohol dehydrogenase family)
MPDTAVSAPCGVLVGGRPALRQAIAAALADDGVTLLDDLAQAPGPDRVIIVCDEGGPAFADTSATAWCDALGAVLREAFLSLQQGAAAIRAHGGGGAVVLVAPSSAGRAFDALHQGLRLLARSAALELGPEGIRVNIILPGEGANPLGRALTPDDIAASAVFAASPRALFMTGADLVVDGGRLAT